jgi:hypothetical protein
MLRSYGPCIALLYVISGASGCATAPSAPKPAATNVRTSADVQCRMERPTGSMLGVKVCTTKAQRDAMKANTDALQQDLGKTQAGSCRGVPGCS